MGSDWFGKNIRMNTTLLQLKKDKPGPDSQYLSMTLVDEDRKNAIEGRLDLKQLEESYAFEIPQKRSIQSPTTEVELFRYASDDPVLEQMEARSIQLSVLCDRSRGIELNKGGEVIQCPGCAKWITPPEATRGVQREEWKKTCQFCGHKFAWKEALATHRIVSDSENNDVQYVDGDSFNGRYQELTYRSLKLGYNGIDYKPKEQYEKPKILIRQAGVGISVAYDKKGAYCPQSVYIYRIKDEVIEPKPERGSETKRNSENGYRWTQILDHRFLLAVLQSRTLAYYVFKRFGEIDASQAFSKLTHVRLSAFPIPVKNWTEPSWKQKHDRIVKLVDDLLGSKPVSENADWEIERTVQELYGLEPNAVAYIYGQLGLVAYHQAMKQMFPNGPPPKPQLVEEIQIRTQLLSNVDS